MRMDAVEDRLDTETRLTSSHQLPEDFFDVTASRDLYWTRFLTERRPSIDDEHSLEQEDDVDTGPRMENSLDAVIEQHHELLEDGPRPPVNRQSSPRSADEQDTHDTLAGLRAPGLLDDDQSPWNGTQSGTDV